MISHAAIFLPAQKVEYKVAIFRRRYILEQITERETCILSYILNDQIRSQKVPCNTYLSQSFRSSHYKTLTVTYPTDQFPLDHCPEYLFPLPGVCIRPSNRTCRDRIEKYFREVKFNSWEMNFHVQGANEYDRLIKPIMLTAKIISIWPLAENSSSGTIMFRRFHLFSMFFLVVVMSIAVTADVIHNFDDLDEATECALICTAFYLCVVRLTVYTVHQKDMLYVVNTMKEDWAVSTHEDRVILEEKTMFAYRLAKYFISTVAITILLFMCVPVLEIYVLGVSEKIFPFRGYFFINQTVSPIFECLYLFNVTAGGFGGSMIAGATSFNLIVIMHGSAKFAVLRKRLESLKGEDPGSVSVMEDCVVRHRRAIEYADALERIINVLALGQFMISTGLICFAGFQITSMMEDKGRLMKYSTFLNSAILELFMFSFSGNGLIDESEAVGESAYNSGWIGSRFCKNLHIMMMRSRTASKITAAKFYSMSLQSFSSVLSTSFSYFTVLRATKDDQ